VENQSAVILFHKLNPRQRISLLWDSLKLFLSDFGRRFRRTPIMLVGRGLLGPEEELDTGALELRGFHILNEPNFSMPMSSLGF
jgi:hypothetical protein